MIGQPDEKLVLGLAQFGRRAEYLAPTLVSLAQLVMLTFQRLGISRRVGGVAAAAAAVCQRQLGLFALLSDHNG